MPVVHAIIPVGPGHEGVAEDAVASVLDAKRPPGWRVEAFAALDERGELGRGKARNVGARAAVPGADWLLWLDADDLLYPDALFVLARESERTPDLDALWGPLVNERGLYGSDGRRISLQQKAVGWDSGPIDGVAWLLAAKPFGSLHVGHFVRPELHERVGGWLEDFDLGEDLEYTWALAMHARRFRKVSDWLVVVRSHIRSSVGPRGYGDEVATGRPREVWMERVGRVRDYWRARGPVPWTREEIARRAEIYQSEASEKKS